MGRDIEIALRRLAPSSAVGWLIVINIVVFISLKLLMLSGIRSSMLELPAGLAPLASRPWSLVTYMFTQYDVWHILFNMLLLYWFGQLYLTLGTERRIFMLYLFGGIAGAVAFELCHSFGAPIYGNLVGASSSVLAIVITTAVMMPDFKIGLLLIGEVAIKWIAIAIVILDILGVSGGNLGGHAAHLGGIIAGVVAGVMFRHPLLFRSRRQKASIYNDNNEAELDEILDKIRRSGYNSLTSSERRRLFDVSKKIKR